MAKKKPTDMIYPEEIIVRRYNDDPKDHLVVRKTMEDAAPIDVATVRTVAVYKLDRLVQIQNTVICTTLPTKTK